MFYNLLPHVLATMHIKYKVRAFTKREGGREYHGVRERGSTSYQDEQGHADKCVHCPLDS